MAFEATKREWGELYAFFRLLAGRAAQIDAQDDGDLAAEGARHGV